MEKSSSNVKCISQTDKKVPEEITETDEKFFLSVISTELNSTQKSQILTPPCTYPRQDILLGVHWHPEFVPMNLIKQRIDEMFPNKKDELIIPTQHNAFTSYGDYTGVEVDCYSSGFNQKVQLLLHFENRRIEKASVLKEMLAHTFKYRSSQLFEFMDTIIKPIEERINFAAEETGANEHVIDFVKVNVKKIKELLDKHESIIPKESIKNKLLRNFFDCLRTEYGDSFIDRVQIYLKAVKATVKANFSLNYFYRTSEIIEEARSLKAGVVIPHPEQFWPVMMAEYDVDGYEVWNPQSFRYTEFLISVLNRKNKSGATKKPLLVFMGDDTHMGEKTRPPEKQDPEKGSREIGFQPAWDDLNIQKTLIMGNFNRKKVIEEYRSRLAE